ncbi:MAG: hypothetical protein COX36_02560 [Candidatus Nealsonbacteria bacterium CG23_combo_of_CG06-09_8_20_14_all_38_19]|uniref:Uncharacterized protein n=1 Tax=Candidatus Nealsonbacteria bacterium CG23_combo_of_CG06-09_8_20_14_all_38_19 TaxID=1974721 RepID=A0A2G9YWF6_9BACT|nr:MAG: hypothetical protein COX36_02560 [Candidatus Nealsonbacteria bacterium CG23_combo_of_CG06-09_8_20_14_all_38_19]
MRIQGSSEVEVKVPFTMLFAEKFNPSFVALANKGDPTKRYITTPTWCGDGVLVQRREDDTETKEYSD